MLVYCSRSLCARKLSWCVPCGVLQLQTKQHSVRDVGFDLTCAADGQVDLEADASLAWVERLGDAETCRDGRV